MFSKPRLQSSFLLKNVIQEAKWLRANTSGTAPLRTNNGLYTQLQSVLFSGASVKWSGCYSTGRANSKDVTHNRKNRLCFSWFLYANSRMHKSKDRILRKAATDTYTQSGLHYLSCQRHPSLHITHTHTHSCMSCSDSL